MTDYQLPRDRKSTIMISQRTRGTFVENDEFESTQSFFSLLE